MEGASVLPYRTDALALADWLAARARGRTPEQLRNAVDSPKAVEGTAAAASALGFTDTLDGALTAAGERFALADGEERPRLLREVLLRYRPYAEVLRALGERGAPSETEIRWIEAYWATRGHGGSESNRREGAAAFGRLADFAELGAYIPGRRGRPTRIRWAPDALAASPEGLHRSRPRGAPATAAPDPDLFTAAPAAPAPPLSPPPQSESPRSIGSSRSAPRARSDVAVNRITVPLAGDATARVEVPLRLPAAEKRRLLDLLELLITED